MLEIIAETVADALAAQEGGATQLDLESSFLQGGLTPSAGLVEQVCARVDIDVLPLIRPHDRGFVYSQEDIAVMCSDIRVAYALGATGFLIGCLTPDGGVDVEAVRLLADAALGRPLHFHVAWELAAEPEQALETMIELGLQSVRVTGHATRKDSWKASAEPDHPIVSADPQAHQARTEQQMANIRHLAHQAAGRIELVVVGGVNAQNVREIITGTRVPNVHSGTGVREPATRQGAVSVQRVKELTQAQTEAVAELRRPRDTRTDQN
jgi:copper homeostasis protein